VLPSGSASNQVIRVQARNFRTQVPIRLALFPEGSNPVEIDDVIDNSGPGAATRDITASFPLNNPTRVMVWTRSP
jgi:hypothetical protein